MEFTTRALKVMQYLVGILMASTVILLVWQHYGMERVFSLSGTSGHRYEMHDDRSTKGASVGAITAKGDVLRLDCQLVKQAEWPFCGIWFPTGKEPSGVDLSDFEYMTIDLRYTGPGPHFVKMYVRNFDRNRSVVEDWGSQRINELEFEIPAEGKLMVPVRLLKTAVWWLDERKIPLLETDTRIDNVIAIELSTGARAVPGKHVIEMRSITFHGKWISQNNLLLILVGLWFTCGIIWPLLRAMHLRAELANREARLHMMSKINHALKLEAKELSGQAFSDALTGALNREGLRDALVKQWQSPTPLAETASIIFMDLDRFKRINDEHGHPVGDEVLRRFSAMVQAEIRATDKLVRWGGEEFLIVCPATTAFQAQMLAEKLRQGMEMIVWPARLMVTASFGVTALGNGEDIGEGIARADDALYRAKAKGRNCVEVAPATPVSLPKHQKALATVE